jgi:cytochrome P450
MGEWLQSAAGEADFRWQHEFGHVIRVKGILGEDRLLISDPKALQYIHLTAGANFVKAPERIVANKFLMGPSVIVAEGADHKRHRKILAPAFALTETKTYIPIFHQTAQKLCNMWKDVIKEGNKGQVTIEVSRWLSRATLDALGKAAFDYEFGALDNAENKLAKAYENLMTDAYAVTSSGKVFVQQLLGHLPPSAFHILASLPSKGIAHMRAVAEAATEVARDIVTHRTASLARGEKIGRDVMSLLIQANLSEKENARISDEELFAQMRTIMFGGHETTANSISWALWELAKNPTVQTKLRAEIRAARARAGSDLSMVDLDDMPYSLAIVKETLRYHPSIYAGLKQSVNSDSIPITTPIRTTDGRTITEIPIGPRQNVLISICGYNRSKDVWGADAEEFRPERWLEGDRLSIKEETQYGIYANLATFSYGPASCIGYRFAIIEFQVILIELIDSFTFSVAKDKKIRRASSGIMAPMVEGELDKGAQLPLVVALASES